MAKRKVLNRNDIALTELTREVAKIINGIKFTYKQFYYLDYAVDEETGRIDKTETVEHYTKDQAEKNIKSMKSAYMIAKGSVDPERIIEFRTHYNIPASSMSLILGFSKNTISNIENGGIASLPSGRFIQLCLNNKTIFIQYLESCSRLDIPKKDEIIKRLQTC